MRLRWIPSGRRARIVALGTACAVILLSCAGVLVLLDARSAAPEIPEPLIQKSVAVTDATGHIRRFEELESEIIRMAIGRYEGHMSEVARRLGIGRSTLYRKLMEFGLEGAEGDASDIEQAIRKAV